ncbi:MAG: hypothetical protein ACON5C_03875 [Alphaproteobacteria bacterium]
MNINFEDQRLFKQLERDRFAVIDIGSNTVRLVVFEQNQSSFVTVLNEKLSIGLGKLDDEGNIPKDRVIALQKGIRRFRTVCEAHNVGFIKAFATAAMRDARNGPDCQSLVENDLGTSVQLLSGSQEAYYAGRGVLSAHPRATGLVGDLGGGSLELVSVGEGACHDMVSLPIGVLRMQQKWESGGLNSALMDHFASITWLQNMAGKTLYMVGGSWRSLVKAYAERNGDRLEMLQALQLDTSFLEFCDDIKKAHPDSLKFKTMSSARRMNLPVAAHILWSLCQYYKPSDFFVSAAGIREGIAYEHSTWLFEAELEILLGDIIGETTRLRPPATFFERWVEFLDFDEEQKKAVLLALAFSDAGWKKHPDLRAIHTAQQVLHADLPGIGRWHRNFAALAVFHRYEGFSHQQNFQTALTLNQEELRKAMALGAALRLAWYFVAGAGPLLNSGCLKQEKDLITFTVDKKHQELLVDGVRKRFFQLTKILNARGCIVCDGIDVT